MSAVHNVMKVLLRWSNYSFVDITSWEGVRRGGRQGGRQGGRGGGGHFISTLPFWTMTWETIVQNPPVIISLLTIHDIWQILLLCLGIHLSPSLFWQCVKHYCHGNASFRCSGKKTFYHHYITKLLLFQICINHHTLHKVIWYDLNYSISLLCIKTNKTDITGICSHRVFT